jgi:lipopolysaccharide assembly outer membrane protein LptD (OstA)
MFYSKSRVFIFYIFMLSLFNVSAQSTAQNEGSTNSGGADLANENGTNEDSKPLSDEEKAALKEKEDAERLIELDIKTSTLSELAEWSKELGLGEGGGKEELTARIRGFYNVSPKVVIDDGARIVTIEHARSAEYFTLEAVDEDYARLTGGVRLSLKEEDALYKISAWEILFNRTRNIVSAKGNVEFTKELAGTIETYSGESITVNLDTWVGSLIETISERASQGNATAYRFAGEVISKTDTDTTVLKKAVISNASSEEPHWSLAASRLWLLPGSDWAVFNAVLKVGEVPVMWLPFFAYPTDDVIFHPVIGTRSREGAFVQTTTYIFGRSISDPTKESSISKILGTEDGIEKKRHGIFLRSTGKKETNPNNKKLSLLLDAYANLGFYTGTELSLPRMGVINNLDVSLGLAWTRTVYNQRGFYTPFDIVDDWNEDWNKTYIFGSEVPFRYRFNIATSVSGRFGSVDFKFPLYSDPFINNDVTNRSEQMDWMSMIEGTVEDDTSTTTAQNIGSYQWNLTSRPNISITALSPYISSISISSISNFLSFVSANDKTYSSNPDSPSRQFFMPDKLTAYSITGSISGTPLTLGGSTSASPKEEEKKPLEGIGEPIAPWAEIETKGGMLPKSANAFEISPPSLSQTFSTPRNSALRFSADYRFSPSSATELQYYTNGWETPADIDWSEFSSSLTNFRTDGSTNFSLSDSNNNLFSTALGFSGSYQWQDHNYIDEEKLGSTDSERKVALENMRKSDYRGRQWTVNSSYNATINPFYWSDIWKPTNFQYSLNSLVAKSLFNEEEYNRKKTPTNTVDPEWKITTGDWTRDTLSTHRLSANIGANIMDKVQELRFSAELPPRYQAYNLGATARIWISETSATMQIQEDTEENVKADKENQGKPDYKKKYHHIDGFIFQPVYLTETFNFGTSKSLRLYTVYDPELDAWTNFTANFGIGTFSTALSAMYMYKYFYDPTPGKEGWKQQTEQTGDQNLELREFNLSWSPSYKVDSLFHNFLTLSFNTRSNVSIDLQRYTYSKFNFSLNITLGITKFLDFTMGATSENAQIYRYMQDLPFFSDLRDKVDVSQGGDLETNVFADLINSFRFDDEKQRRKSGFKLKSFNFSAVHHLGDWDASLGVIFTPYLDQTLSLPEYKFRTTVSFYVRWIPISEIETEIDYENEKFMRKVKQK